MPTFEIPMPQIGTILVLYTVADPGFPVWGGIDLIEGAGIDSRGRYVSKILYIETKESGSLGGRALGTPPRSANDINGGDNDGLR